MTLTNIIYRSVDGCVRRYDIRMGTLLVDNVKRESNVYMLDTVYVLSLLIFKMFLTKKYLLVQLVGEVGGHCSAFMVPSLCCKQTSAS